MCILFCAIYTQTMLRKKNIAKKEGYSCAQNIADYLRIVLDYCLLGCPLHKYIPSPDTYHNHIKSKNISHSGHRKNIMKKKKKLIYIYIYIHSNN